ncbi:MAG: thioredoxin [Acutalibacteraceae bacterium]
MAIVTVTKENFEKEVLQAEKPVMVDFWATWCGPCRMLSPIVDQLAEERADAVFGKVNVDEQQELAAQFGIMSIPTVVVFKNGKVVRQTVGAQPKAALEKMLESI